MAIGQAASMTVAEILVPYRRPAPSPLIPFGAWPLLLLCVLLFCVSRGDVGDDDL